MSNKFIIGGAVAAAGGYYLYQQRLQAVEDPHHRQQTVFSSPTSDFGERTGRKFDESRSNAKQTAEDVRRDAQKKIDEKLSTLEDKRASGDAWASRKLTEAKDGLNSRANEAQQKAEKLYENAHPERTGLTGEIRKVGDEVKGTYEGAKSSIEDKYKSAKGSLVGAKEEAKQEGKGWFGLGGRTREEELALEAKQSLRGWGETAAQSSSEYYDGIRDNNGSAPKSRLFSWGERKADNASSHLERAKDDAQRAYDDAVKKVNETKKSWFSWSQDPNQSRLHEEAQRKLNVAKQQLDTSTENLKRAMSTSKPQYEGFYDWLRGGVPYQGESPLVHDVHKSANEWNSWFNRKYDEGVKGAQDFYNDANAALRDAQKHAEENTNHWYNWGVKKSKEVELDAKRNLEEAERRAEKAKQDLQKWGQQGNVKFWSSTDDAISTVKDGLNEAHRETQRGLSDARSYAKERK